MNEQHHPTRNHTNAGRIWAGIIIIGIGSVLLAGKLGFDWLFPHWIFSWRSMWPIILIIIGLIIGGNSNFKNPATFILVFLGALFLVKNHTHFNLGPLIWPTIIIGIGLWLLFDRGKRGPFQTGPRGPRSARRKGHYEWDKRVPGDADDENDTGNYQKGNYNTGSSAFSGATSFDEADSDNDNTYRFTQDDYIKSTAVFSEVKKTVISKNFKGGEIVNVCGGTDINLVQADIHHPVVIDLFQIFAGMKIIVPAHWKIKSEVVSVFGEVDDRRFIQGIPQDDNKVVYIKGTSLFGGVTIKNI